jgi:hypothetical protein
LAGLLGLWGQLGGYRVKSTEKAFQVATILAILAILVVRIHLKIGFFL